MPYSREDIVQMVAEELGAPGDGNPVEPEDAKKIRNALPSVVADLDLRDIASFPDLDAVPDGAVIHFAVIVASNLSSKFGLPQDEITILASRAQAAEGKLRTQRSLPYSGGSVPVCYF